MEEIDILLDRLHAQGKPILADIDGMDAAGSLVIGLGHALSALTHNPSSKLPPYRTSLGDPLAEGGTVSFMAGHPSEMENRWQIPVDQARAALRRFCLTGEFSDNIVWEDA
jgi:hypothetical protein